MSLISLSLSLSHTQSLNPQIHPHPSFPRSHSHVLSLYRFILTHLQIPLPIYSSHKPNTESTNQTATHSTTNPAPQIKQKPTTQAQPTTEPPLLPSNPSKKNPAPQPRPMATPTMTPMTHSQTDDDAIKHCQTHKSNPTTNKNPYHN